MLSKYLAPALLLGRTCLAQTSTTSSPTTSASSGPTCGFVGWDESGTNIGYYTAETYDGCNELCTENAECLSFAIDLTTPACILYNFTVVGHDIADPTSPWTFYDRGGACPTTTTATSTLPTSAVLTTTAITTATPTCSGFLGYDDGTNIGFYADAASATYSGCLALCDANSECLSFGLTSAPACILYNYTVAGNDIAGAGSGNTFYDKGGVCPSTTTSSVSSTLSPSNTSSVTTPVQTGAFPNCPSNLFPYNFSSPVTPYSSCNSNYPSSACMSDVDGKSSYCNVCLSCTNTTCTSDSDCGTGYACIKNSACAVTGATTGTPVCLYMLAGGEAMGCYDSA